jgi:hypothetical protein
MTTGGEDRGEDWWNLIFGLYQCSGEVLPGLVGLGGDTSVAVFPPSAHHVYMRSMAVRSKAGANQRLS